MEIGAAIEAEHVKWRLTRLDVAGAFGDVAILFPIAIALISLNHMNPTAVFLTAGLAYILAGAYYQIPIPVQPFKAVAAIALALQLSPSSIASAGLLMGVLLALVGLTNLVTPLAKLFSLPIIRGIQLGLGLILAREGFRLVFRTQPLLFLDGRISISAWMVGLIGAAILLALRGSRRFPAALVLLGAGVLVGSLTQGQALHSLGWGPVPLQILHPQGDELRKVLVALVLPQFALTFGNSIVATENTAHLLYGAQARRVTVRGLSMSIGLMNLASGMLLSAPTCHGSGGITAHYKFGARTPKSSYVIGSVCLFLAFFGKGAVALLHLIPTAVLGVFLVYVGIQHALFVRDIAGRRTLLFVALSVAVISLAKTNLTYGFIAGFLLQGLLNLVAKARQKRSLRAQAV